MITDTGWSHKRSTDTGDRSHNKTRQQMILLEPQSPVACSSSMICSIYMNLLSFMAPVSVVRGSSIISSICRLWLHYLLSLVVSPASSICCSSGSGIYRSWLQWLLLLLVTPVSLLSSVAPVSFVVACGRSSQYLSLLVAPVARSGGCRSYCGSSTIISCR